MKAPLNSFVALGHAGEVATRILSDGTLERVYRVLVGKELIEYRDAIRKTDVGTAHGRIGMLRHKAVVRRIEAAMQARGIKELIRS